MPFELKPWAKAGVYERKPLSWIQASHRVNRTLSCSVCGTDLEPGADYFRGIDYRGKTTRLACSESCRKEWSKS